MREKRQTYWVNKALYGYEKRRNRTGSNTRKQYMLSKAYKTYIIFVMKDITRKNQKGIFTMLHFMNKKMVMDVIMMGSIINIMIQKSRNEIG